MEKLFLPAGCPIHAVCSAEPEIPGSINIHVMDIIISNTLGIVEAVPVRGPAPVCGITDLQPICECSNVHGAETIERNPNCVDGLSDLSYFSGRERYRIDCEESKKSIPARPDSCVRPIVMLTHHILGSMGTRMTSCVFLSTRTMELCVPIHRCPLLSSTIEVMIWCRQPLF